MSADLLRSAADTLRERAGMATPGPWGVWDRGVGWHITQAAIEPDQYGRPMLLPEGFRTDLDRGEDATYIATMHPGVALALADWLEATADVGTCECGLTGDDPYCEHESAVPVARAILGEPS